MYTPRVYIYIYMYTPSVLDNRTSHCFHISATNSRGAACEYMCACVCVSIYIYRYIYMYAAGAIENRTSCCVQMSATDLVQNLWFF